MTDSIKSIMEAQKSWEEKEVAKAEKRFPERKEMKSWSNLPVKRVYTPADVEDTSYLQEIGFPGQYPFLRHAQATGYLGKMWTRRPITGFNTPKITNERVRQLLKSGQTGLHFVFDYPTLAG